VVVMDDTSGHFIEKGCLKLLLTSYVDYLDPINGGFWYC
jgi:hypothetical protein